jgi:hypothetical protein
MPSRGKTTLPDPRLDPTIRKNTKTPIYSGSKPQIELKTLQYDPRKSAQIVSKPTTSFPSTPGGVWKAPPNRKDVDLRTPQTTKRRSTNEPNEKNEIKKLCNKTEQPIINTMDEILGSVSSDSESSCSSSSSNCSTPVQDENIPNKVEEYIPERVKKNIRWTDMNYILDIPPMIKEVKEASTQTSMNYNLTPEVYIGYPVSQLNLHQDDIKNIMRKFNN